MNAKTAATAAVLVAVSAAPIVNWELKIRRRNKAASKLQETVDSTNAMMNKLHGTTDVVYITMPQK